MPTEKRVLIMVWKMQVFKDSNIKYIVFLMWKKHYQIGREEVTIPSLGIYFKTSGDS